MDSSLKNLIDIQPEIAEAISKGKPVVALESTIITHGFHFSKLGMDFPVNLNTAVSVEAMISAHGAVPATIALINGRIKVGLTHEEMEPLAQDGKSAVKCSRRNLAYVISQKLNGSTTVAATMIIAKMVGIKVFVTGGIGGVHRGAETTFDISADLTELGKTEVAVVCAGVKSILDIPKTLEVLETQGVPVIGYKSKKFPEFFFGDGDCDAPITLCKSDNVYER